MCEDVRPKPREKKDQKTADFEQTNEKGKGEKERKKNE